MFAPFLPFLFLFSLFSVPCHSQGYCFDDPLFAQEWNRFVGSLEIDNEKMEGEAYQEYEFQLLEEFSKQQACRHRPYIQSMDRYLRFRPYADNKMSLADGTEMSASLIQFANLGEEYHDFIATQAPFNDNIHLFWQMVWENGIDQIVMVTEFFDYAKPHKELAYPYWPQVLGEHLLLQNGFEVTLAEEKELVTDLEEKIQMRKLLLRHQGEERKISHYWYRNWVDNTTPNQTQIFNLIHLVENEKRGQSHDAPILVHCSAGVGRTGVFIALYHAMQRAKNEEPALALFDLVGYLRWQRPCLVGTLSQYKFCHTAKGALFPH